MLLEGAGYRPETVPRALADRPDDAGSMLRARAPRRGRVRTICRSRGAHRTDLRLRRHDLTRRHLHGRSARGQRVDRRGHFEGGSRGPGCGDRQWPDSQRGLQRRRRRWARSGRTSPTSRRAPGDTHRARCRTTRPLRVPHRRAARPRPEGQPPDLRHEARASTRLRSPRLVRGAIWIRSGDDLRRTSGGEPVAVVANQPDTLAGSIDAEAADKAAHFIAVAAAFHLPLVFLADNPGMLPGGASERQGVLRSGARMFAAQTLATAAKIHLTLRKAYGFGSMVMSMVGFDQQVATFNFPAQRSEPWEREHPAGR